MRMITLPLDRTSIAISVKRLINTLDATSPDPDLEPEPEPNLEAGDDDEPTLGVRATCGLQTAAWDNGIDHRDECEDESSTPGTSPTSGTTCLTRRRRAVARPTENRDAAHV